MPPTQTIRSISAEQTYPLRLTVLRPNQTLADCVFPGDQELSTIHFGAYADDILVGVATLLHDQHAELGFSDPWRIRGMATDPSVRGFGHGKDLVRRCFDYTREQAGDGVWCNARASAEGFYRRLGFDVVGEEFDIPGIGPHYVMQVKV